MNAATDSIAVLILAAGASRRLGQSKALLPEKDGKNLVQQVVDTALSAGATDIYVVIQPDDDAVRNALRANPVQFVPNLDWQEGMASSIRNGIGYIRQDGRYDAVLILLVDQPELTADILRSMMSAFTDTQRIVACQYDNVIGVPTLIGAEFLDNLMTLTGDHGARNWLRQRCEQIAVIPFPGGARDIDVLADLDRTDFR